MTIKLTEQEAMIAKQLANNVTGYERNIIEGIGFWYGFTNGYLDELGKRASQLGADPNSVTFWVEFNNSL